MEKHFFSIAKIRQELKFLVYVLAASMIFFIFFEGLCSIFFVLKTNRPIAERMHTKYDEQLGWINIPNILIKDMYGAGVYLRTNSQGFRGDADYDVSVPEGKIRIICSGDSFTFGYGVDNDHTWCRLLSYIDPRLEVVNMGQGGYGIEQDYLWYMRDGIKLEHRIHIVAIISDDFLRFGKKMAGYGKPCLKIQNGSLVVCNTPVPARPFYIPWLTENIRVVRRLRSAAVLKGVYDKLTQGRKNLESDKIDYERRLSIKIFEELNRVNKGKNSTLMIVYLPTFDDFYGNRNSELRAFLDSELSKRNIMFLDLVDDFNKIPISEMDGLFIRRSRFLGGMGHYTVKGNEYVGRIIYKKLSLFLSAGRSESL